MILQKGQTRTMASACWVWTWSNFLWAMARATSSSIARTPSAATLEFIFVGDGLGSGGFNQFVEAGGILWILETSVDGSWFRVVAAIMGSEPKGGEVNLNLGRDPLFSHVFLEDTSKMGDPDPSLVSFSHPLGEVFIDPLSELLVLLDLMICLGQGTATGTAEGTEGKPFLFGKGKISGCHQEVSVMVHRFDRVSAAAEFGEVREVNTETVGPRSLRRSRN